MIRVREFRRTDRYQFDFGECLFSKMWAQLDTPEDAAYYGNWANPLELKFVSYCEGDITRITFESVEEMGRYIRSFYDWSRENHGEGGKIDPYYKEVYEEFRKMGLGDLLSPYVYPREEALTLLH